MREEWVRVKERGDESQATDRQRPKKKKRPDRHTADKELQPKTDRCGGRAVTLCC